MDPSSPSRGNKRTVSGSLLQRAGGPTQYPSSSAARQQLVQQAFANRSAASSPHMEPLSASPTESPFLSQGQDAFFDTPSGAIPVAAYSPNPFGLPATPSNTPNAENGPFLRRYGSFGSEAPRHTVTHDDLALFLTQKLEKDSHGAKYRALSPPAAAVARFTSHVSPPAASRRSFGSTQATTGAGAGLSQSNTWANDQPEPDTSSSLVTPPRASATSPRRTRSPIHVSVPEEQNQEEENSEAEDQALAQQEQPHGLAKASTFLATSPASSIGSLYAGPSPRLSPRVVLGQQQAARSPSRSLRASLFSAGSSPDSTNGSVLIEDLSSPIGVGIRPVPPEMWAKLSAGSANYGTLSANQADPMRGAMRARATEGVDLTSYPGLHDMPRVLQSPVASISAAASPIRTPLNTPVFSPYNSTPNPASSPELVPMEDPLVTRLSPSNQRRPSQQLSPRKPFSLSVSPRSVNANAQPSQRSPYQGPKSPLSNMSSILQGMPQAQAPAAAGASGVFVPPAQPAQPAQPEPQLIAHHAPIREPPVHIHPGQQMPAGHHPAKPLERMQDGVLYQKINRAAFYSPGVRTGPSPHSLLKKLPGKIVDPTLIRNQDQQTSSVDQLMGTAERVGMSHPTVFSAQPTRSGEAEFQVGGRASALKMFSMREGASMSGRRGPVAQKTLRLATTTMHDQSKMQQDSPHSPAAEPAISPRRLREVEKQMEERDKKFDRE